jgi:hypothetical protein
LILLVLCRYDCGPLRTEIINKKGHSYIASIVAQTCHACPNTSFSKTPVNQDLLVKWSPIKKTCFSLIIWTSEFSYGQVEILVQLVRGQVEKIQNSTPLCRGCMGNTPISTFNMMCFRSCSKNLIPGRNLVVMTAKRNYQSKNPQVLELRYFAFKTLSDGPLPRFFKL